MTLLATWGCASEFFKMLLKFKMAVRGQLQKNLWAQKLDKMAATDQLQFFGGAKNQKISLC